MRYTVRVKPNAKKTNISTLSSGELIAQVKASPQNGKANDELIKALAQFFKIPQSSIKIKHGASGKKKHIEIQEI